MRGHTADLVTHAKFCDNQFRDFRVVIPLILPFSIGIAGRPYNSVSTTVLHWDKVSSSFGLTGVKTIVLCVILTLVVIISM